MSIKDLIMIAGDFKWTDSNLPVLEGMKRVIQKIITEQELLTSGVKNIHNHVMEQKEFQYDIEDILRKFDSSIQTELKIHELINTYIKIYVGNLSSYKEKQETFNFPDVIPKLQPLVSLTAQLNRIISGFVQDQDIELKREEIPG